MGSFMGTQSEIYIIELNIKLNQEDIECVLNWFLGKKGIQTTDDCFHTLEKAFEDESFTCGYKGWWKW